MTKMKETKTNQWLNVNVKSLMQMVLQLLIQKNETINYKALL